MTIEYMHDICTTLTLFWHEDKYFILFHKNGLFLIETMKNKRQTKNFIHIYPEKLYVFFLEIT